MYATIVQHILVVPTLNTAGTVRCGTHLTCFRCVVCVFVTDNSCSMTYKASYCWSDWGLMPIYTKAIVCSFQTNWKQQHAISSNRIILRGSLWTFQPRSPSPGKPNGNQTTPKWTSPPKKQEPTTPTTTNNNKPQQQSKQRHVLLPERVTLLYMLCSNSSKELVNLHHSALPPQDVYDVYDGKVMGARPGPFPKKSIRMVTTI